MGLYCHVCHKVVDLPTEGEFKSTTKAGLTTRATFQCLDPACWERVMDEHFQGAADRRELARLIDLANTSRPQREARIRAGNPPRSIAKLRTMVATRRNQLAMVRDQHFEQGQGAENEGGDGNQDEGMKDGGVRDRQADAQPQKQEAEAASAREYRRARNGGRRRNARDGRGFYEVGAQDDVFDFDNLVIEALAGIPQIGPDFGDDDDDNDENYEGRRGRQQWQDLGEIGGGRELVDAMSYAEIPGVLYNEQGRPYYEFVDPDDADRRPREYGRRQ